MCLNRLVLCHQMIEQRFESHLALCLWALVESSEYFT